MASLKNIIRQLEIEFSIYVEEQQTDSIRIENVQYLIPGTAASVTIMPLTLYVGDYTEFFDRALTGSFLFLNVPKDGTVADGSAYIYHDLNISAVLNCIQTAIFAGHKANMQKEEMFHILQAGYGVQAILDSARTILQNPLTMCTTSFSLIAVSPREDTHQSFETINDQRYLKKESLEHMRRNNIMERLFHSSAPIVTRFDDAIGIDFIFLSIRINRAAVGYLCLRCSLRPHTEEDLAFLRDVAGMLSIEMQKDNFYNHQTGIAYEYFLRDLVEQNISSPEFALHRMTQLGRPALNYFWVFVFAFQDETLNKPNFQYYIDQLIGIFRRSICFAYKDKLVLLLTSKDINPFRTIDRGKFESFLHLNRLRGALSHRYEEILNTHLYYRQALFLLMKETKKEGESITFYEKNYHNHLFSLISNQAHLKAMIHPDINILRKHDALHNTDYISTLTAYFANSRNALKTSTALHIHKSTFFYRIGKIQMLTGLDLEDETLLFAYAFSFYILTYLENSK